MVRAREDVLQSFWYLFLFSLLLLAHVVIACVGIVYHSHVTIYHEFNVGDAQYTIIYFNVNDGLLNNELLSSF